MPGATANVPRAVHAEGTAGVRTVRNRVHLQPDGDVEGRPKSAGQPPRAHTIFPRPRRLPPTAHCPSPRTVSAPHKKGRIPFQYATPGWSQRTPYPAGSPDEISPRREHEVLRAASGPHLLWSKARAPRASRSSLHRRLLPETRGGFPDVPRVSQTTAP